MTLRPLLMLAIVVSVTACSKTFEPTVPEEEASTSAHGFPFQKENPASFQLYGSIDIGGTGAAEISAYDPKTQKLFVVNNTDNNNRIDVINFSDPSNLQMITSISISPYGGLVNSVDVKDGKLAAAIESVVKTDPGKVVIFNTDDYSEVKVITVGALPDMVTYSPDGKLIVTANEGEPNNDYSIDPPGSISIISVKDGYSVHTLDFASFAPMQASLINKGLRIFGPGASFTQDIEPEYVTISKDSKTAWVTLQENNAIAKVDLVSKMITGIFPLGFKNYNLLTNAMDPSDRPLGVIAFNTWPVYGIYLPDGIAVLEDDKGFPYLFTANEGDARDYAGFAEEVRIGSGSVILDPTAFPNAATLKLNENLGRLNITKTMGDTDNDGDYDKLYSFGARSFSIWDGNTGSLLYDSHNDLEQRVVAAGLYDDDRSDNKGVEPEGITVGEVNKRTLAFVGMERADAVAIYDVTDPLHPAFLQIFTSGDAPEGVLFIHAKDSPIKRSLLVVSSENDGVIKIFIPDTF